jgi:hypothetical protein
MIPATGGNSAKLWCGGISTGYVVILPMARDDGAAGDLPVGGTMKDRPNTVILSTVAPNVTSVLAPVSVPCSYMAA